MRLDNVCRDDVHLQFTGLLLHNVLDTGHSYASPRDTTTPAQTDGVGRAGRGGERRNILSNL